MSFNVWSVSRTLLTLSILSLVRGEDIGDECTINDPSGQSRLGVCELLLKCPSVYEALLAGRRPDMNCGFKGFSPVVCCPVNDVVTTTKRPITTEATSPNQRIKAPQPLRFDRNVRGSLARAKCAENAKEVYAIETPPILLVDRDPVNVSRCAVEKRTLIVGGEDAEPKEFPHMTALGYEDRQRNIHWLCGGSLISDRIVITAAHCLYIDENLGGAKWARIGDLNLVETNDNAEPQTIKILDRIPHPNYKLPKMYHDIALLRLEESVIYSAWVRPACLPTSLPDIGYQNRAIATGWGHKEWGADAGSNALLKVTLNVITQADCNRNFGDNNSPQLPQGVVNDWQLCAGENNKDTCQGDSGGPLAIFNPVHECMYDIIGITSVGQLCGVIPGVYTRVYHYIPWIEEAAWPEYFTNDELRIQN